MEARPPAWALAAGFPVSEPGETFQQYWSRVGMSDAAIETMFIGLTAQTECIANDRMATHLFTLVPNALFAYANSFDRVPPIPRRKPLHTVRPAMV